jgi:glucans biosynthesis protein
MKTHLVFGTITIILLIIVISTRRQESFSYQRVVDMAEDMARNGYLSGSPAVPKVLRELNYDQLRDIRWRDDKTLWRSDALPFQIRFFLPGGGHLDHSVEIYQVEGNRAEPVPFRRDFFDFGKNVGLEEKVPLALGFSGFRIHNPINKPDVLDEVAVFLGASYFRAVPKGLNYGLSARGLAIGIGEPDGKEEFPTFTKFWLVKPETFADQMTVYALLESRSVTGAYQFDITPGVETRMYVRATLFFRAKVSNVGFAPLTSMFWFGENTSDTFGNFRPEVHDSDGLLMQTGKGEWIWHPLAWSKNPQVNIFSDEHPGGFGLLQRDRDFNHYQDLEAVYHKRPSLWVQPVKGFEKGSVRLMQFPTDSETWDNVAAYWHPENPPPFLEPVELEYSLRWFGDAGDLPPVGRVLSTRIDYQERPYFRQFFLEFSGGALDRLTSPPTADISATTNAQITDVKVEKNEFNKSWRVTFFVSTPDNKKPVDILCRLKNGDEAVSETWSYTWSP